MRTLLIALTVLACGVALLAWWIGAAQESSPQPAHVAASPRLEALARSELDTPEDAASAAELDASEERDALGPSAAQRAREEREARTRTRVVGRLFDSTGAPAQDVRVLYALADRGPEAPLDARAWQAPERKLGETRSDADGRFSISPAPIGLLRVALRSAQHAPRDLDGVFVVIGGTTDLGDVELPPGVVLAGHVLSAEGAPVADAWLIRPDSVVRPTLGSFPGDRGVVLGQSAPDGSFALPPQPVGPWTLLVHSPEHPDFVVRSSDRGEWRDESRLELRFPPSSTIEGRVSIALSANAPRLGDLEVRAQALDEPDGERAEVQPSSRRAKLGPYGEFSLVGVPLGGLTRVQVFAPKESERGDDWVFEGAVEARGGERDVELIVGAVASVTLTVRDASTGETISIAKAQALVREPRGTARNLAMRAATQSDGRILLRTDRTVEPGTSVRLSVRAEGYFSAESAEFALPSGASVEAPTVELEPRPKLEFRVSDAVTGRPLAGARVALSMGPGALASVSSPPSGDRETTQLRSEPTDAQGHTHVWGERIDCGWAVARLEHYAASAPLEVCFRAASGRIEIGLSAGPTLAVRVLDATGAPAPSRKVMLRRDGRVDVVRIEAQRYLELDLLSDSEGVCRFEGLTPGSYRASLLEPRIGAPRSADEHARTFATVALAPEGESQLDLFALRRGVLSGRVSFARAPLANAVVMLTAPPSPHPRAWNNDGALRARTDAEGRYRFEQLGPGDWSVTVFHAELLVPTNNPLSYDGDQRTFDIAIPRTALVGRIVDKAGNPVEGARIVVGRWQSAARGRDRRASPFQRIESAPLPATGYDGCFTLLGAPGERIAIEVRHPQHQRLQTKPFTPEVGVERDLGDLVLEAAASLRVELARMNSKDPRPRLVLRRLDGPKDEAGEREVRSQSLDPKGRALVRGLAPGRWRVEIDPRREGLTRPRVDVQLKAHETRAVEFESL